jgi:hypothetical protein
MPFSERPEHDSSFQTKIDLEEAREVLLERILHIEQLARDAAGRRRRELELEARLAVLEKERSEWLRSKEDWERERDETARALDHDRSLLADSWRRLELAQTQQSRPPGESRPSSQPHLQTRPTINRQPAVESAAGHNDPIAESVVREFKTLLRDVQNSNKRSVS